jgi:hypothetical protein
MPKIPVEIKHLKNHEIIHSVYSIELYKMNPNYVISGGYE